MLGVSIKYMPLSVRFRLNEGCGIYLDNVQLIETFAIRSEIQSRVHCALEVKASVLSSNTKK